MATSIESTPNAFASKIDYKRKPATTNRYRDLLSALFKRAVRDGHVAANPVRAVPKLKENSIDLILMVDVYHEFSHPYEMTTAMVKALKPGGRLVFVEYRLEDPKVPILVVHGIVVNGGTFPATIWRNYMSQVTATQPPAAVRRWSPGRRLAACSQPWPRT